MRTLAALLFIAGTALVAIALARTPTVADGRVVAAGLLEEARKEGATAMECDPAIPIGALGAVFTCTATLAGDMTQVVEYQLTPDGQYRPRPRPPNHNRPAHRPGSPESPESHDARDPAGQSRNSSPHDPWGN